MKQGSIETVVNYLVDQAKTNNKVYKATNDDLLALNSIAQKYNIPFEWFCNLINFETGKTFSPSVKNPTSSASGLIQFMEATARDLGTTTAALRAMTFKQQLVYVDKYLNKNGRGFINKKYPPNFTQLDLFMQIFYPAAMYKGPNYTFNQTVQNANPGIKTAGDYYNYCMKRAIFPTVPNDLPGYENWIKSNINTTLTKGGNIIIIIVLAVVGYMFITKK